MEKRKRGKRGLVGAVLIAATLALGAVLVLGWQEPIPQSLYEEDDLSEAELAGRLSHAIDAHEKCRRHWPHLEKLEAAQEIRVHDARNNLEVSNRAMERARKELRDAEGLVLAARQEHQAYEAQRVAFQSFKSDYDQRTLAMKETLPTVQLDVRSGATAFLQSDAQLEADAKELELKQRQVIALESTAMEQLKERNAVELAASTPARTEDLAQVEPQGPAPILTTVRSGIVVPEDSELAARKKKARKARVISAEQASKLVVEEAALKRDEIKAFAELPSEETLVAEVERNLSRQRRRETMQRSRVLVARRHLRYLERRDADDELEGMARKVQVAKAKKALADVDLRITEHKIASDKKEIATLKVEERAGPSDSEKLSAIAASLRKMGSHRRAALAGRMARETELVQVGQVVGERGRRGRSASVRAPAPQPKAKKESRAQLRKEVEDSRKALKSIRNQLLAVQSRLAAQGGQPNPAAQAQAQAAAAGGGRGGSGARQQQQLLSRHHDLPSASNERDSQVLRDSNFQPTMALYNVYEEKLTALREERKKADGLLAKAERMLNIARIDSLHAAKTKKAALEELKYATSKLRRYQDLRSKSQHCQMDAWSEIRELTHRARRSKMLEGKDKANTQALKAFMGKDGFVI